MFLQSASSLSKAYRISLATCLLSSDSNQFLSNHVTASAKRSHKDRCVNIPLARMNAAVSMASSTRLRSFSAFSSHCFLSSSKCSTDAWLLGFIRTMWAAFTTWGTRSAAYRHTAAHVINTVPLQNWNNYTVDLLTDKTHTYNLQFITQYSSHIIISMQGMQMESQLPLQLIIHSYTGTTQKYVRQIGNINVHKWISYHFVYQHLNIKHFLLYLNILKLSLFVSLR